MFGKKKSVILPSDSSASQDVNIAEGRMKLVTMPDGQTKWVSNSTGQTQTVTLPNGQTQTVNLAGEAQNISISGDSKAGIPIGQTISLSGNERSIRASAETQSISLPGGSSMPPPTGQTQWISLPTGQTQTVPLPNGHTQTINLDLGGPPPPTPPPPGKAGSGEKNNPQENQPGEQQGQQGQQGQQEGQQGPPGVPPGMQKPEMQTGTLRQDIELIRPGIHGDFAMLFDPGADAYYKITPRSLDIISRIDRNYTVTAFLEKLNNCGLQVTKDELLQLLAFLHQSSLIAPEYGQMEKKYDQYIKMKEDTLFLRFTAAYMFFRLPPVRPERLFKKIRPAVSWLASKAFVMTLLLPAIAGYIMLMRHMGEVAAIFVDSLSWAGLAKYFLAILVMKVVHEAAHSISAIHFNCRVRGIGVGFMVFYPRLYTDTTDSWRLPRMQRLLIDASGIIIELIVGGIAALIWVHSPPGTWRSTMFYIFAVSTISTLFVNGNPCIRYDGYYILCDVMNIENLMTRSSEYFKQWWRWHFLRLGSSPKEEHGLFLFFFGVCTFIYRIFLYTSIILIIYNQFVKAVAVVLLFLELYSIFIYPMYKEIKMIRALSKKSANKARLLLFIILAAVVSIVLFMPLSWNISLSGEIVPVSFLQISIGESGYLNDTTPLLPEHPVFVKEGTPVFRLDSAALDYQMNKARADYEYLAGLFDLQQSDKNTLGSTQISRQKLRTSKEHYVELLRRKNYLAEDVNLPGGGIYLPKTPSRISTGMYLPKGLLIAEIVSTEKMAYAYASERDIPKIKLGDKVRISVRDSLKDSYGRIEEIDSVPAKLRNSPLLQQFGGPIPVYIDEHKAGEYTSVLPLYRLKISFDEPTTLQLGRTLSVEVIHRERLYDTAKQYFISFLRKEF